MEVFLHFLHILAAAMLIGSTFFVGLVMIPVLRKTFEHSERRRFFVTMKNKARVFTWSAIFLLLITGFYRVFSILGTPVMRTEYGGILMQKIGLALALIALVFVHDFILGPKMTEAAEDDPGFKRLRLFTIVLAKLQLAALLLIILQAARLRLYIW